MSGFPAAATVSLPYREGVAGRFTLKDNSEAERGVEGSGTAIEVGREIENPLKFARVRNMALPRVTWSQENPEI